MQKIPEKLNLPENIYDVFWVIDHNAKVLYINKTAEEFFGMKKQQLIGKNIWEEITYLKTTRLYEESQKVLTEKAIIAFEERMPQNNRWYHLRIYPGADTLSIFAMNITEHMETEKRKDEFISMASHELKTPVTSMKLFVEILKRHLKLQNDKQGEKYIVKIAAQIDKLKGLIDDLLDVSRIQTGKLRLNYEKFNLDELIARTVEALQGTTDKHYLIFGRNGHVPMYADRFRIEQVLANLLTNAIKYSPEGGDIEISLKKNADHVTVSIKDQGIGISQKQQEKIFDKLYQVNEYQEKNSSGLGMGLYIVGAR